MKSFQHHKARSLKQATSLLAKYNGKARVNAGGTDLLGNLRDQCVADYPEALINIKTIPGLDYIKAGKRGFTYRGACKAGRYRKIAGDKKGLRASCGSGSFRCHSQCEKHGHSRREPGTGCALLVLSLSAANRRADHLPAQRGQNLQRAGRR